MIERSLHQFVLDRLALFPAVALLGPRQVGKTTLARLIADDRDSVYLDLGNPRERRKLADIDQYLDAHEHRLVVLEFPGLTEKWAIEIKSGFAPSLTKGFYNALQDLAPQRSFVVYAGDERYPLAKGVEAIGATELCQVLASMKAE